MVFYYIIMIVKKQTMKHFIKRYYRIIVYLFGAILTKGISYLTTPIFTRMMSTEEFGELSLLTTWTTIFSIFVAAQISGTIPSIYAKYKENIDDYIRRALLLSFISLGLVLLFSIVLRNYLMKIMNIRNIFLLVLVIWIGYGKAMSNLFVSYTVQRKQAKSNVIFSSGVALAVFVLGIVFTLFCKNNRYMGKTVAEVVVYTLVVFFILHFFDIRSSRVDVRFWREELELSVPLIFHLLATNIISQSDKVFISNMIGLEATAIYSVSCTIGMIALVVVEAIFNVWGPWFFERVEDSANQKEINNTFLICVLSMACIFAITMMFAREFFIIMAPDSYAGGINSTVIIALSTFFSFYYRFPLCYEQYKRKMKWVAFATALASICNIILNYFLIPYWGIDGAAFATLVSQIILWVIHEAVVRYKIQGYPIRLSNYLMGIIAIIPAVVLLFFNQDNIWYRIFGGSIYIGITIWIILKKEILKKKNL